MRNAKLYIYNVGSHTLHIRNFCTYAHGSSESYGIKIFDTENDAVQSEGRGLRMCESCMKKRDEILAKIAIK